MKKLRNVAITFILAMAWAIPNAQADNIFGEFKRLPDEIERGFSLGFDFGALFFTGEKRTVQNPGFSLAVTMGYDLFEYLSLEAISLVGISEADPQDPRLDGSVNTVLFNLAAKGQMPLGRFFPFIELGPGIHYSKPVFVPGENWKMSILGGAGIEYYTYLRHYSLFAKVMYLYSLQDVDMFGLSLGLRYTF